VPPRPVTRALLYARAVRDVRRAGRDVYRSPWLRMYGRALGLRRRYGFALDESLAAGHLDPRRPFDHRTVSKREMTRAQAAVNPPDLEALTENKALLYRCLTLAGIPVPAMLAHLARGGGSWDWHAGRPVLPGRWADTFAGMPGDIVVKPALGYHGRGVRVLTRDGGAWRAPDGATWTDAGLAQLLEADREFSSWVVQRRVENHPVIAGFASPDILSTLRVVTFVDVAGAASVEWVGLRLGRGDGGTDNFDGGRSGNLSVTIDPASGVARRAVRAGDAGLGLEPADPRDRDGGPLVGLRLPLWDEVRELALRTALALLPMRCVGLDVAITPEGPVIIEANMWWEGPPDEPLRPLLQRMRAAA
jgi:hypothetical protein